jgi:His/Glu/Gln/Arg/opine family amino acid ABC transporter permease subunit
MIEKLLTIIRDNYFLLSIGLLNTIKIWFISIFISLFIGFFWGSLREEKISNHYIAFFFDVLAYIVQGVPFYIVSLISFFYIAPCFGFSDSLWIGSCTLGVCSAAYGSQIIKVGYQSIPLEQWQLAKQLGYPRMTILVYIIVPQMITRVIPLYINECDQLLKSTTILSTLGILDLTKSGLNIISHTFEALPVYSLLFFVYLFLSMMLRYVAHFYKKNSMYKNFNGETL